MKKFFLHTKFIIIILISFSAQAQNKISVTDLKCEMLSNPEGIDVLQPRLSWKIKANVNDVKQTSYQILASSSLEKLTARNADLWDSGKVQSDASVNVIYNGKKLKDREDIYWKVIVSKKKAK